MVTVDWPTKDGDIQLVRTQTHENVGRYKKWKTSEKKARLG